MTDSEFEIKRRPLTTVERVVLGSITRMATLTEGYFVAFGEEVMRTYGVKGFMEWAKLCDTTQKALRAHFGVKEQHLLSSMASLWNGCEYCAHGNLFAHNLLHFQETGELFPLDEVDLFELASHDDDTMIEVLRERFTEFPESFAHVSRQWEFKSGRATPEDGNRDDEQIYLSMRLYDFINECSIVINGPAPPFNAIAKDKALIAKYEAARDRAPDRAARARALRGA